MTLGEFKCCRCDHEFKSVHGAGRDNHYVDCPECGHKYVEWLNYEAMKKSNFK